MKTNSHYFIVMSGLNHSADSCEAWYVDNAVSNSPAENNEEPSSPSQNDTNTTMPKWEDLNPMDTTNEPNTDKKIKKNSTIPVRSSVVHNK